MADTAMPDYPRGITFEQVWAAFMESKKRNEELRIQMQENAKEMKETDRRLKETEKLIKENAREMKETGRRMGYLSNRFGELAEHLVAPGIKSRFEELGYRFDMVATRGGEICGADGKVKTEIDLYLENDEIMIVVEVKSKPSVKDVDHHIKRLEIVREFRKKARNERKILGAIAGAVFGAEEKKATIDAGMYVIEQSGDTMKIDMPEGFIPREW